MTIHVSRDPRAVLAPIPGHWKLILESVILAPRLPESNFEPELILADWSGVQGRAGSNLVLWHLRSNSGTPRQGQMDLHWICLCPNPRISSKGRESTVSPNHPNQHSRRIARIMVASELAELDCCPNWKLWCPRIPESTNRQARCLHESTI